MFFIRNWREYLKNFSYSKIFHNDKEIYFNNICDSINNLSCSLKTNANTVIGRGSINTSLLFIGEAPGEEEDKLGVPFVGASGVLLKEMINSINIDINKVYITNICFWRPPLNRPPTEEEINICLPMVKEIIKLINPKLIVTLGSTATKVLHNKITNISKVRGIFSKISIKDNIYESIPTFHPSYILRIRSHKSLYMKDFLTIQQFIKDNNLYEELIISSK
ncbi:hypothetical protein AB836_00285 [Rickettsiales bacterium (ex Bugula neritina AB1)]|nr:hypothetical protein AB836_00285 [Rickettsiales bacterium (ex Bugula neritina AB1)]